MLNKTVVFTFGRMQPPTLGHEKLINKLVETARENLADHVVYLSQTRNNKTDPLEWDFKRRVCSAAFKGVFISNDKNIKNPFIALEHLSKFYSNAVMVVGSDQATEFEKRLNPYSEKIGINLSIVSAGDRITESAGVCGISATKVRQYVMENQRELFLNSLASGLSLSIKNMIFEKIQIALSK